MTHGKRTVSQPRTQKRGLARAGAMVCGEEKRYYYTSTSTPFIAPRVPALWSACERARDTILCRRRTMQERADVIWALLADASLCSLFGDILLLLMHLLWLNTQFFSFANVSKTKTRDESAEAHSDQFVRF